MTLKETLKNLITCEVKIDDIYTAVQAGRYYKQATIDRELRRLTEDGLIAPLRQKNYNIAYMPVQRLKTIRRATSDEQRQSQEATEELNNTLKDILGKLRVSWDMVDKYKEIDNAIKSKTVLLKESVIKKYENN
jgi:predicted transcriptional regulator